MSLIEGFLFNIQYTPYAVPLAISALVSILLILYLYERRTTLGAKPAMAAMATLFIWSAGYMLEFLGADISTKLFWAKIQYFGILGLPLAYLWFALEFSNRSTWLTKARLAALQIIPIAMLFLVLSNESHRQVWSEWDIQTIQGTMFLYLEHGIAFWVNITYTYILLVASTALMITAVIRRPDLYRKQIAVILTAIFAPWIGNAVSNFGILPVPIDLTPFGFTLTGFAIVWGISKHSFLDITPVAYETVFDSMGDAVFILDVRNTIVDVNTAGLEALDLSTDQVIGHHARDVFKEQADLLDRFQYTMNIREEISVEVNSQIRFYELSIFPLVSRQNNSSGRAIVFHDISDRKKAEVAITKARDQALQANQTKSQFLARISHELRTPLGVIRGYADLLNEPAYGTLTEPQKKAVNEIIESNQRVADMVSELLDEARLAAGAVQLENRQFAPADILEDVKGKLSVLAQQKNLTLTTELNPELPNKLIGDPTRIGQIVTNFASNSIKFTQKGGVNIRFYPKSKNFWAIEVSDTGPGIPKDAQEEIFEPFRQADKTIARKYGGTGLGLSIVKHLTNLMDGKIDIKSEVGVGSTFTVTLPLNTKVSK